MTLQHSWIIATPPGTPVEMVLVQSFHCATYQRPFSRDKTRRDCGKLLLKTTKEGQEEIGEATVSLAAGKIKKKKVLHTGSYAMVLSQ